MPAAKPVSQTILDLSIPEPNSGCWLWLGCIDRDGYSKCRNSTGHKKAYEAFVGAVPEGMEIDHKCNNRGCVNPAHLTCLPHLDNVRRISARPGHRNRVKTHCVHGHEFTEENTKIDHWRGVIMRRCRECRRRREAARPRRKLSNISQRRKS